LGTGKGGPRWRPGRTPKKRKPNFGGYDQRSPPRPAKGGEKEKEYTIWALGGKKADKKPPQKGVNANRPQGRPREIAEPEGITYRLKR